MSASEGRTREDEASNESYKGLTNAKETSLGIYARTFVEKHTEDTVNPHGDDFMASKLGVVDTIPVWD